MTTTTTSPEQAAAAQLAADRALIMAMLRSDNDAWNLNRSAGIQADVANSWPPSREAEGMTPENCNSSYNPDLWWNAVVDANTIQPQPGWVQPKMQTVPEGRIYVMTAQISSRYGDAVQPTQTQEMHAVVAPDAKAYYFPYCGKG